MKETGLLIALSNTSLVRLEDIRVIDVYLCDTYRTYTYTVTNVSMPFISFFNSQVESIAGEVFRPRERIKSQSDFNRVGRFGRNFSGQKCRVQWIRNDDVVSPMQSGEAGASFVTNTRLGIKTPKKQIKRAVDRNLVKRRVRDVFRKNKGEWPQGVDIVVYCGSSTLACSYQEFKSEMLYWAREVVPRVREKEKEDGKKTAKPWKKRNGEEKKETPPVVSAGNENSKTRGDLKRGKGAAVATAEE